MYRAATLALALAAAACNSQLSGDEGVDGGSYERGGDGGFIEPENDGGDASDLDDTGDDGTGGGDDGTGGGATGDGEELQEDFGNATVTASCLFLRSGPGTNHAKVDCDGQGPECNGDGDVCIPMGSTVDLQGDPESGTGCTQWFPLSYDGYTGYSCGAYLELSGGSPLILIKEPTFYPAYEEGPMG